MLCFVVAFCFVFDLGFHYAAQADLELSIRLPQPFKLGDHQVLLEELWIVK